MHTRLCLNPRSHVHAVEGWCLRLMATVPNAACAKQCPHQMQQPFPHPASSLTAVVFGQVLMGAGVVREIEDTDTLEQDKVGWGGALKASRSPLAPGKAVGSGL